VPKQFLLGFDAPLEVAFTLAALGLAAAGIWLARREAGAHTALALGVAAIGLPLVAAVGADFVLSRNLIVALLPLLVAVAAGFASARQAGLALAAGLTALSLATVIAVCTRPEFQRDDWRGAAEALGAADVDRALVVNPIAGATPLRLYLDDLEPFGEDFRPVGEIALIAVAARRPGETPRPPRPPSPGYLGYELAERREADTFTLVRLRAIAEPRAIASAGLTSIKLVPGRDELAVTLMQPASR
jgi:hypothetical protein